MGYFWKLNIVSACYAFFLFVSIELQLNFYRIWRLSGWEPDSVNLMTGVIHIVGFVLLTFLIYYFNKKWLRTTKLKYWTAILWIPYLFVLLYIFANLFPMTNRGDTPAPVTGLIMLAQIISYPFYLSVVYFLSDVLEGDPEESLG
ncbi:hypothetical protein [Psychrobacillus soli]|uniref:Uncharacterized protein n=1 Tax=Psychrobacillus soli TaxID=1543965 RepID=A0A544TDV3_9BACI|nr:hypothetical protein [Psychrobacillus soli]TQR15648.1 hypothetical protein FG383_08680 [Psychrobacillus soli]